MISDNLNKAHDVFLIKTEPLYGIFLFDPLDSTLIAAAALAAGRTGF
jgi:hypothetical protein